MQLVAFTGPSLHSQTQLPQSLLFEHVTLVAPAGRDEPFVPGVVEPDERDAFAPASPYEDAPPPPPEEQANSASERDRDAGTRSGIEARTFMAAAP